MAEAGLVEDLEGSPLVRSRILLAAADLARCNLARCEFGR